MIRIGGWVIRIIAPHNTLIGDFAPFSVFRIEAQNRGSL